MSFSFAKLLRGDFVEPRLTVAAGRSSQDRDLEGCTNARGATLRHKSGRRGRKGCEK